MVSEFDEYVMIEEPTVVQYSSTSEFALAAKCCPFCGRHFDTISGFSVAQNKCFCGALAYTKSSWWMVFTGVLFRTRSFGIRYVKACSPTRILMYTYIFRSIFGYVLQRDRSACVLQKLEVEEEGNSDEGNFVAGI